MWLAYQKLENPDVVYWETLLSEVAQNATVNLPETVATAGGYVKNGVKSVATGAGELISGAASGLGSGFFSKLTAKGSLVFFTALIGYLIFKGFITPKTFKR